MTFPRFLRNQTQSCLYSCYNLDKYFRSQNSSCEIKSSRALISTVVSCIINFATGFSETIVRNLQSKKTCIIFHFIFCVLIYCCFVINYHKLLKKLLVIKIIVNDRQANITFSAFTFAFCFYSCFFI